MTLSYVNWYLNASGVQRLCLELSHVRSLTALRKDRNWQLRSAEFEIESIK